MKKLAIALLTLFLATFAFAESGRPATVDRLQAAAGTVLHEIMAAPDKGIPAEVLTDAKCIAVIPGMGKGGIHRWWRAWTPSCDVPDKDQLERAGVYLNWWR